MNTERQIVECVPNFSEGRDMSVIKQITDAIESVSGVTLLNVDPGEATNRTVVTFVGSPESVCEAAFLGAKKASEVIDMRHHHGAHPRMGATDVLPLIPISGITLDECAGLARKLAERMAKEAGIPCYAYEAAALRPERKNLAVCRAGEYEAQSDKLTDPARQPDYMPTQNIVQSAHVQRCGCTAVGARDFLIAVNWNLNTTSTRRANAIAFDVREKGRPKREGNPITGKPVLDAEGKPVMIPGTLKATKAIGWYIDEYGIAQVSMNMTDLSITPLHVAFDEVSRCAEKRGLRVTGTEIVGLVPKRTLIEAGKYFLRKQHRSTGIPEADIIKIAVKSMGLDDLRPFNPREKVIEYLMEDRSNAAASSKSAGLLPLTVKAFAEETSRESPAPGGGSVSAYMGALGAALGTMVANLSSHKPGWDDRWQEFSQWADHGQQIMSELLALVDEDTQAFNGIMAAFNMPKKTDAERIARNKAIQEATLYAAQVPLRTMKTSMKVFDICRAMVHDGNPASSSDAGVGALAARAAVVGAGLNVKINAASLSDRDMALTLINEADALTKQANEAEKEILSPQPEPLSEAGDNDFREQVREGIPSELPPMLPYDTSINHAPRRKDILNADEKRLALRNALRYFPSHLHAMLAPEFAEELRKYGRIYMYRYRPSYPMYARNIDEYPHQSLQAAAIMMMIQNNLDPRVAQHPHELITYGGNGAVFQNWAQYRLTMKYLSEMTDEQTLVMYSGHPLGLFPSHHNAPRVVVTNGMVIPNYSKPDDWERMNALGVSQYGQMTAGSYMYIGPQGIVHGTTITVLNAARRVCSSNYMKSEKNRRLLFVTAGLGGMSGAQPKAADIAGVVSVTAEINPKAAQKRFEQGWVDRLLYNLDEVVSEIKKAMNPTLTPDVCALAYVGNVVNLWERLADENIHVDLGSDQTSLHNPWAGGYYPVGLTLEESQHMMADSPELFKEKVKQSLRRHVAAINRLSERGMYFFDYGNAFLLESGRAGADVFSSDGKFRYPSYVQDIMGPLFFDYGFGPFRWVCTSGDSKDLEITDRLAADVLANMLLTAPDNIRGQLADNLHWIREAGHNNLVVGSQARILYADAEGRTRIALAFNEAIRRGEISRPIVLGRDHHDVSGTDSPYRETSNITDGSQFCADMAVHNVIGDSFRGATWVSLHNGGGVGWGEVINGGFGMVIDGTSDCDRRIRQMLLWDVNNGIARRSWARNSGSIDAIRREMERTPALKVTLPSIASDEIIDNALTE